MSFRNIGKPAALWKPYEVLGLPTEPEADVPFPCVYQLGTAGACTKRPTKPEIALLQKEHDRLASLDPRAVVEEEDGLRALAKCMLCFTHKVWLDDAKGLMRGQLEAYVQSLHGGRGSIFPTTSEPRLEIVRRQADFSDIDVPSTSFETPLVYLLRDSRYQPTESLKPYLDYETRWQDIVAADRMCSAEFYTTEGFRLNPGLQALFSGRGVDSPPPESMTASDFQAFFLGMIRATAPSNQPNGASYAEKHDGVHVYKHAKAVLRCEQERWGPWLEYWAKRVDFADTETAGPIIRLIRSALANMEASLTPADFALRPVNRLLGDVEEVEDYTANTEEVEGELEEIEETDQR